MEAAKVDWSMGSNAGRLIDWNTAAEIGRRVGGPGPQLRAIDRARMREDLAEIVPHAESLVSEFTGLPAVFRVFQNLSSTRIVTPPGIPP